MLPLLRVNYHVANREKMEAVSEREVKTMTSFEMFVLAVSLGIVAGITPGPLSTLVLNQALKNGWRAGAAVAIAPLAGDVVIVVPTLLLLEQSSKEIFTWLSLVGGVYVVFLGWETLRNPLRDGSKADQIETTNARGFLQGLVVNWLNPHPYMFWLTVAGPLVRTQAALCDWMSIILFLIGFYGCLVGCKILFAVMVHAGRLRLQESAFQRVVWAGGLVLLAFGIFMIWNGFLEIRRTA